MHDQQLGERANIINISTLTAGIASTFFATYTGDGENLSAKIAEVYEKRYGDSTFVRIRGEGVFTDTKHVVGTNFVDVGWVTDDRTGRIILSSAEDNLGKGAGSQAIQSFNLVCGLPEESGLLHF